MVIATEKKVQKRMRSVSRTKSDVSEAIHSAATALFKVGAINKKTMRDYDDACLVPADLSVDDVRRIREKLLVSQEVLARAIGTTKSAVAKWESGVNTPSPMAQRLLRVVDKHGLDILD